MLSSCEQAIPAAVLSSRHEFDRILEVLLASEDVLIGLDNGGVGRCVLLIDSSLAAVVGVELSHTSSADADMNLWSESELAFGIACAIDKRVEAGSRSARER